MTVCDCKVDLLKYGVKFSPIGLFNNFDPNEFKMKYINKKPQVNEKMQVFDVSTENNQLPAEILIEKNGKQSLTKLRYNENSPVELKFNNDKLEIYKDGELLDFKMSLVRNNLVLEEKIPSDISKHNFKVGDFVNIVGLNRVTVLFFDGCYNWLCGKNCKFCDLHPKRPEDIPARPTLNNLCNYSSVEEWWNLQKEDYLRCVIYSLKRVLSTFENKEVFLFFMAGNLQNIEQVWKVCVETIQTISKHVDLSRYVNYLNIAPHDNLDNLKLMKDLGINNVQYNLEIANEKIFTDYCPGKISYNEFLNKLLEATVIFGKGNVRSNFVLGLQPISELLEFADKYGEMGIVVDYSVFQPKKGTPLASHPTLPFEEVVEFSRELVKIYKKFNFKPIFSTVSSRSSIMNELYEVNNE